MKLSIIIPYYNTERYTNELLSILIPQITDDVEVIFIDDASPEPYRFKHSKFKCYRNETNLGPAKTRNKGLELAKGEYIQFIDSDDLISKDFVQRILEKIPEGNELIEFSWKSLNSTFDFKLYKPTDRLRNPSVVTRTFKRSYIGSTRFNELKDATEDEDFSRRLGYLYKHVTVSVITDYLYFYRTETPDSNVKSYKKGLKHTKRITYYYNKVTSDRTDILESIKKDDEENEVFLLTNECDIPELKRYCQILPPIRIWTHYLKGELYYGCEVLPVPVESQVILYIRNLNVIGGIETFIYHFLKTFSETYDITLVVSNISAQQKERFKKYARVLTYSAQTSYSCDTLIMLRILDTKPSNIHCKQSIQMCHACRTNPNWGIPQDSDYIINVSQSSKDSFGYYAENGIVLHNLFTPVDTKSLILMSATRIPASDKGKNVDRMITLANMLNQAKIPFIWFNFSEGQIPNPPRGVFNVGVQMDIRPYIQRADYLVQLSDCEAWSYSILEALTQNVAVLVCPFDSAEEMGIEDGKNGYILPFDMNFDVTKLLNVPKFTYIYNNDSIVQHWKDLLGPGKKVIRERKENVTVRVRVSYYDKALGRTLNVGDVLSMSSERVDEILEVGHFVDEIGGL